jgi:hypothetical protein
MEGIGRSLTNYLAPRNLPELRRKATEDVGYPGWYLQPGHRASTVGVLPIDADADAA